MNWYILLSALAAFCGSYVVTIFIQKYFPQWRLLDNPRKYGHKRKPVPLPGGVGIPVIFSICALLFLPFDKHIAGFVLAILILTFVSFWDDRRNISPIIRLGIQIFAGVIIVASGIGIEVLSNPFGGHIELNKFEWNVFKINGDWYQFTILSDFFTIVWVVIMMNTLNWLDGVPGLSAGTAAAGGITLGFLSMNVAADSILPQENVALLSFVFAASILAFLPFNIPPIKMLLGDAGAMPLGLILATLAIFSGGKVATAFLVLALPILDAVWVGLSRFVRGKKPWEGKDNAHLHDKLLIIGWSERQIFALFFIISVSLGISSLFLKTTEKGIVIIFLVFTFALFRFWIERRSSVV